MEFEEAGTRQSSALQNRANAELAVAADGSGGHEQGAALLTGDPTQKHGPSRAQLRAEPENRDARARRKVIDLAAAAVRAEQKFRDLVSAAKQIIGEVISSGACFVRVHAGHPSLQVARRPVSV